MYENVTLRVSALPSIFPLPLIMRTMGDGRKLHETGARIQCDSFTGFVILDFALSYMDLCDEVGIKIDVVISDDYMVFTVGDQTLGLLMKDEPFEVVTLGDRHDGLTKIVSIIGDEEVRGHLVEQVENIDFLNGLMKSLDARIMGLADAKG